MEASAATRLGSAGRSGGIDSEPLAGLRALPSPPALEARDVTRRFGTNLALDGVSLAVAPGELHALLGPNGAGKTVMLRILTGLLKPSSGSVRVMGAEAALGRRAVRAVTGFVPAGDRSFYLRLSGLENLVFFGRLQGLGRRQAGGRAIEVLEQVGLAAAARTPVGVYSHGMQKRLSVARALLTGPSALLVDEATHDLDPQAAAEIRALVESLVRDGAAVIWTTQRIDEIRGFAHRVTLLGGGRVRFAGSVNRLIAHAQARRFVVRLGTTKRAWDEAALAPALRGTAAIGPAEGRESDHWLLTLADESTLGEAIGALAGAGIPVLACHRERSEIEEAFVSLSGRGVR